MVAPPFYNACYGINTNCYDLYNVRHHVVYSDEGVEKRGSNQIGGLEHHVISRKADHSEHGTRVTFLPIQFFKRGDPIEKKGFRKLPIIIFHTEVHTFLNFSIWTDKVFI